MRTMLFDKGGGWTQRARCKCGTREKTENMECRKLEGRKQWILYKMYGALLSA
jgi:hypothetical protein